MNSFKIKLEELRTTLIKIRSGIRGAAMSSYFYALYLRKDWVNGERIKDFK